MQKTMTGFLKESKERNNEIKQLRSIAKGLKLDEEFKWGKPCYCYEGNNIAIIQPFKKYVALMFFKGKLLNDPKKVLVDNGPNSQSAARMEFTSAHDMKKNLSTVKSFLKEAIKIAVSGQKVEFKKKPEPFPKELKDIFKKNSKFKMAFEALTPGRQRGYILHFSGAKQSSTRISRIEKCKARIMSGKGLSDR
jgi:uncharacterized protein YdeI (YjbR/CyaY-like superfamily)